MSDASSNAFAAASKSTHSLALTNPRQFCRQLESVRYRSPIAFMRVLGVLDSLRDGIPPYGIRVDDARIPGLRKVNLTSGHRVCWIRQDGGPSLVLFLGTHEETELFLDHHHGRTAWPAVALEDKTSEPVAQHMLARLPNVRHDAPGVSGINETVSPLSYVDAQPITVSLAKSESLREIITRGWADFEDWLAFLHPEQRRLVEMNFSATVRVRGRSGTGKTIVLLHRALRIASEQVDRAGAGVLILTHNEPIATRLNGLIGRLCGGDEQVRKLLEVSTIDDWCSKFLREEARKRFKVDREGRIMRRVMAEHIPHLRESGLGVSEGDLSFYGDEISYLFGKFESLADAEARYLDQGFKREGRRRAFRHNTRQAMIKLFRTLHHELLRERHYHKAELAREAADAIRSGVQVPSARAVMMDEVQVASDNELKLIAAIAGASRAELFMAGDDDQSILTQGFSFASTGIHLQRGVPCVLHGNYRNSRWIADFLNRFAASWPFTADGRNPSGLRALDGAKPVIAAARLDTDELRWVAASVVNLIAKEGFRPGQICCVVRSNDWRVRLMEELHRKLPSLVVEANRKAGVNRDSVKVTTIESTLGQEFRAMFILNATEGALPSTDEQIELLREARLFYTAAGRARDRLYVSYSSRISQRPAQVSRFIECILPVSDVIQI